MKTVFITGASGGIGQAIAMAFAGKDYRLCLHGNRNREAVETLAASLRKSGTDALAFIADLSKPEDVEAVFADVARVSGGVDILVNNAGVALIDTVSNTTAKQWDDLFSVNTRAAFLCAKEAQKHMIAEGFGRIINISSMWGVCGASCEVAYSASKAAVIGFTKALAKELAPSCITVNCVAPGVIDTPMNCGLSDSDRQALIDMTPVGRMGRPEDVARAVAFFADDKADFITGQTLICDGGFIL